MQYDGDTRADFSDFQGPTWANMVAWEVSAVIWAVMARTLHLK